MKTFSVFTNQEHLDKKAHEINKFINDLLKSCDVPWKRRTDRHIFSYFIHDVESNGPMNQSLKIKYKE